MDIQAIPSSVSGNRGGGLHKNKIDDKQRTVAMKGEKGDRVKKDSSSPSSSRSGGGVEGVIKEGGSSGFTSAQLKELEVQTLIHRHLAAGLPVPFHLVLPICKTMATTYATSQGGTCKQYPSFVGFSLQRLDNKNTIDTEPGRCRRTDGKKWRCSRNVVPDQKYCVQHMHRGRQRSRKPVETSEIASHSSVTRPNNSKFESENSTPNLSTSVGLQLMTRSADNTSISHGHTSITSSYYGSKKRVSCTTAPSITVTTFSATISPTAAMTPNITNPAAAATTSAATTTTAFLSISNSKTNGNNDIRNHAGNNFNIRGSSNDKIAIAGRNLSPGLDFSPKSVLRVTGCNNKNDLCFDSRIGVELEPGRCRRTDGKKWRCSRNVVPDQKYCARHMHRGAKKRSKIFQTDTGVAASDAISNTHWLPPTAAMPCRTVRATPSTNLSISIPGSPVKTNSSFSSDTTLTDTSISAYMCN